MHWYICYTAWLIASIVYAEINQIIFSWCLKVSGPLVFSTHTKRKHISWPTGLWRRQNHPSTAQRNVLVWHSHTFWMHSGWNNRAHDRLITCWWSQMQLQCFPAFHRCFSKGNRAVFGLSQFGLDLGLADSGVLNVRGFGSCSGKQRFWGIFLFAWM